MPYNPNQPRDPGGKDGGRWVKSGGKPAEKRAKSLAGRSLQKLGKTRKRIDMLEGRWEEAARRGSRTVTVSGKVRHEHRVLRRESRRIGDDTARPKRQPGRFSERKSGKSPLKRAGDELFRVRIDRVRSGRTDSGRNARFGSGDN
jgi:hypothetical protein